MKIFINKIIVGIFLVLLLMTMNLLITVSYAEINKTLDDAANWVLNFDDGEQYEFSCEWMTIAGVTYDCRWQCVDFVNGYTNFLTGTYRNGNAQDYNNGVLPDNQNYSLIQKYNGFVPRKGDILIWDTGEWGHVAIVTSVNSSTEVVYSDQNGATSGYYVQRIHHGRTMNPSTNNYWGVIRPALKDSIFPRKNVLSGVYVIHSAWNDNYCLDIQDNSKENNANIQLYQRVYDDVQKFRIIKWSDNYYCIQSIYNGLWLDIKLPIENRANVKLYENNKADENDWYFEDAGDGYVYIRNRSGYYLDIAKDAVENNANIQIYSQPENNSQRWRLEEVTDYCYPEDGVYTVSTARNSNYRLDIFEDSKENRANIQLYRQLDTPVQLFRFIKKGSYYVIQSVHSGKWLDIHLDENGNVGNNSNVQLWESNTADEEHWVLEDAGDGYVYMRSNKDYYLDIQGDVAKDNANIQVYHFANNDSQRWQLVKYEHNVKYDANEGMNAPSAQVKVYDQTLTLSNDKPTREGYTFLGWATSASATSAAYQPGDSYKTDADVTLYAVWRANTYTVSYNANTADLVANMPTAQAKIHGVNLTLSEDWPTREGYSFICWSEIANGYLGNRYPGSVYTKDAGITFYAMWQKDGSEMTSGAGKTLLEGDYTIWAALDEALAFDIEGTDMPSANGRNVGLSTSAGNAYDAWTLTYLGNGFYAIKQYRTDMALTVADDSVKYRANIQVNAYTGCTGQQWSIELTDYGYRLKARCSGFSADIPGGVDYIKHGTNVQQWNNKEGDQAGNQSWTFRPYKPAQGLIPDFTLPASLKTVEAEAFVGGAFRYVKLSEGITAISARAFADCPNLKYIYIPEECSSISKDAFSGISGLTIFGVDGSYAEFFAEKYGYKFEAIGIR